MKLFQYRAVGADGAEVSGLTSASGEHELDADFEERGLLLTSARELSSDQRTQVRKLSGTELVQLASTLSTLSSAGVPIREGLSGLSERSSSPRLRALLTDMLIQLEAGKSLSEVVEAHSKVFPRVFRASVSAGESSGSLGRVLSKLAEHMEWAREMRSMTIQALIYPSLLLCAVTGLIGILLYHVLPNIVDMFPGGVDQLPSETQLVLQVSNFLTDNIVWIAGATALAVGSLIYAQKQQHLRERLHRALLLLPGLGTLASKLAISKFASTAAVLKSAGCDVFTLLNVSARTVGNAAIEAALTRSTARVKAGQSLSRALDQEPLIDPLLVQIVGVGEQTGELENALADLANHYDRDVPRSVKRTLAIVEPTMLLVAGAIVAVILLAAMLPIFDMYDLFG